MRVPTLRGSIAAIALAGALCVPARAQADLSISCGDNFGCRDRGTGYAGPSYPSFVERHHRGGSLHGHTRHRFGHRPHGRDTGPRHEQVHDAFADGHDPDPRHVETPGAVRDGRDAAGRVPGTEQNGRDTGP